MGRFDAATGGIFEAEGYDHRRKHGEHAGLNHFSDGGGGGDGNAVGVLGLAVGGFINLAIFFAPFFNRFTVVILHFGQGGFQFRNVFKLALDFLDHIAGSTAHGLDCHRREKEGQHRAHE